MDNNVDSSVSASPLIGETIPTEAQGVGGINTSMISEDIHKIHLKEEESKIIYDEIQSRKQESLQESPSVKDEESQIREANGEFSSE